LLNFEYFGVGVSGDLIVFSFFGNSSWSGDFDLGVRAEVIDDE